MLAVLAAAAYYLYQNNAVETLIPNVNFFRQDSVTQEHGYLPGLFHTDYQEKSSFSTIDPGAVRPPFGGNPFAPTINIYGPTSTMKYQEEYKDNIENVYINTLHPVLDGAFNSALGNFDQQGHQISYPGVQQSIANNLEYLKENRPHWSQQTIDSEFKGRRHDGQLQPTFYPQRWKTK